jgi:hypothetical protein
MLLPLTDLLAAAPVDPLAFTGGSNRAYRMLRDTLSPLHLCAVGVLLAAAWLLLAASWSTASSVFAKSVCGVQYSLVYPATYDPARSGRINARTGFSNTTQMLVHRFDPISFGPVQRKNRI